MELEKYQLIWEATKNNISKQIKDKKIVSLYLDSASLKEIKGNKAYIVFDSGLAKNVFDGFYNEQLCKALQLTTESDYEPVLFTKKEWKTKEEDTELVKNPFLISSPTSQELSFSNFVRGECNNEAHVALKQTIENMKKPLWNPIFIYGESGLGKTHLLNAVYNELKKTKYKNRVLYINSSDFISTVFAAFKRGSEYLEKFKKRVLADNDLIMVDDVQFLANKVKTTEIFYLLFTSFVEAKKPIITASDTPPSNLTGFNQRLVSRFSQGLTIAMQAPGKETAMAILETKIKKQSAETGSLFLDQETKSFLASRFSENIRLLEGVLNRLVFWGILHDKNIITLPVVMEALKDDISFSQKTITVKNIIAFVAKETGVPATQIKGASRISSIVVARHLSMALIKNILDLPFVEIAGYFSGKNHSTIMAAVKKVAAKQKTDFEFKSYYQQIENKIKA